VPNASNNVGGVYSEGSPGEEVAMYESEKSCPGDIHILVVDDEHAVRDLLQQAITRAGYDCLTASNAKEALKVLEQKDVGVVITDIKMPGLNGDELTRIVKQKHNSDVIIMTGYVKDFTYKKAIDAGANDFINKTVSLKELVIRLKRVLRERRLLNERNEAEKRWERSVEGLEKALSGTIRAMASTVETRDPYTAGHQRRTADLARAIATEMGVSRKEVDGIHMAGLIHDLGKISVPAEILSKPARLNELEFGIIKTHPKVGYDILKPIEFPWPIAEIVLQHHERMDGSGYPNGLRGEDIRLEARILAVADVVEAMASHRPYRPSLGIDKALEEISENKGVVYDAKVVDACLKLFREKGFKFEQTGFQEDRK
jgi:response regulator RpfG family c-di-GMP phosphodiesterase